MQKLRWKLLLWCLFKMNSAIYWKKHVVNATQECLWNGSGDVK